MAAHYGTAVLPGRVRHPRDKAKVETAVLIVERFILAKLRNRRFLSLGGAAQGSACEARGISAEGNSTRQSTKSKAI